MTKIQYNEGACFNLVSEAIKGCFADKKTPQQRKRNRAFANGKLIELFVDCSENFESGKLRKEILLANKVI